MSRQPLFRFNTLSGNIALCTFTILLFVAGCGWILLSMMQSQVQQQTMDSRYAEAKQTAEQFDRHIEQLRTMLYRLYDEPSIREFGQQSVRPGDDAYNSAAGTYRISDELRPYAYDSQLHLEGIIAHYVEREIAVDQNGADIYSDFFQRAYASSSYPASFWPTHHAREPLTSLLPAAAFHNTLWPNHAKMLLPLTFRLPDDSYQLIALWNVERSMAAYRSETDNADWSWYMEDEEGRPLYESSEEWSELRELHLTEHQPYTLHHDQLLVRVEGDFGMTYYAYAPFHSGAAELQAWRERAAIVFAAVILLASASSYWFGRRLKRPVEQLAQIARQRVATVDRFNGIHELMGIDRDVRSLLSERQAAHEQLERQRSALTSLGYIGLLKNIAGLAQLWEEWQLEEGTYDIVLYDIRLRQDPLPDEAVERPEQAARMLQQLIEKTVSSCFPDAHTFPMERQQVLSVIRNGDRARLTAMLQQLKTSLDQKTHYGYVTIAVSSQFQHASQCHYAYEQVQAIARQAMLLEETQIMTQLRSLPEQPELSRDDIQLLKSHLQSGQDAEAIHMLESALNRMQTDGASASQIRVFTEQVTTMISTHLDAMRGNPDSGALWTYRSLRRKLTSACSLREYKEWLIQFVHLASSLFAQADAEPQDPTVIRLLDILETKYDEDLSLDYVAAELNMSPTYLSTYMKEKTGVNFAEHLSGIRMAKATELLTDTSLNINEIGRMVGYSNTTSFNRAFKKWHGIAPGEYRKRNESMVQTG
ncbi:AraC family transcriptional regulator [Paenibacillus sp. PL2-23]|uniref:helix-turn-helix domain-containing protein n=1 Tax=Paenibacillus sp. PL2-23 TaxID=2100729 RepID=UPI0030F575C8